MKHIYFPIFLLISCITFAQPANDNPCTATVLSVGSSCTLTAGTTVGSTNTTTVGPPSCSSYSNRDVWYSFTAPASGSVTIETTSGTITDGAMSLYSGPDCSTLSEMTCDDDGGAGLMPLINASGLTSGTTYYIRFWRYSTGTGTFNICVYDATSGGTPPANDDPCAATSLTVDTVCSFTAGTNADATSTTGVPAPGCAGYSGGDVWFTFTVPSSGIFEITTQAGTLTDGGMAIYSGTCSSLSLITCDDDGGAGLMPFIASTAAAGTTLWIRVWEFGNDVEGSFNICVTEPTLSTENNDCVTSTQICTTSSFDDNSSGDGSVNDLNASNRGCLTTNEHQSAWYYFQVETGGTLTYTIDPDVNTDDFDFAIWGPASSCPPSSSPTRCSYSASSGNTGLNTSAIDVSEDALGDKWVQQMNVLASEIYIICVDNFSSSNNGFTFSFGGSATINCEPVVLPVSLVSFTGVAENSVNILSWITATEVNANYFSIEHSTDGVHFSEIGKTEAAGNSTEQLSYEYFHTSPSFGNNYYRLMQYDNNGAAFPSHTITLSNTVGSAVFVYPNPATEGFVNVYMNGFDGSKVTIEMFTAFGQTIYKTAKAAEASFTEKIQLPAKGIYWISVQSGDKRWTEKVIY
ncbi:MAG: T9SS type A sorting domain-containing protein [Chitinophagales bacterium]